MGRVLRRSETMLFEQACIGSRFRRWDFANIINLSGYLSQCFVSDIHIPRDTRWGGACVIDLLEVQLSEVKARFRLRLWKLRASSQDSYQSDRDARGIMHRCEWSLTCFGKYGHLLLSS